MPMENRALDTLFHEQQAHHSLLNYIIFRVIHLGDVGSNACLLMDESIAGNVKGICYKKKKKQDREIERETTTALKNCLMLEEL